jgi:hypothetical protein
VAVSVATAAELVVALSHCSFMPAGSVKVEALLQAPPKTSSAFGVVVVIEGALTEVDGPPLLCPPEPLIGVVGLALETSSTPPEISAAAPPVREKAYEEGSDDPAILYQPWIRTSFEFARSALAIAVQPAGGVMFRRLPPWCPTTASKRSPATVPGGRATTSDRAPFAVAEEVERI